MADFLTNLISASPSLLTADAAATTGPSATTPDASGDAFSAIFQSLVASRSAQTTQATVAAFPTGVAVPATGESNPEATRATLGDTATATEADAAATSADDATAAADAAFLNALGIAPTPATLLGIPADLTGAATGTDTGTVGTAAETGTGTGTFQTILTADLQGRVQRLRFGFAGGPAQIAGLTTGRAASTTNTTPTTTPPDTVAAAPVPDATATPIPTTQQLTAPTAAAVANVSQFPPIPAQAPIASGITSDPAAVTVSATPDDSVGAVSALAATGTTPPVPESPTGDRPANAGDRFAPPASAGARVAFAAPSTARFDTELSSQVGRTATDTANTSVRPNLGVPLATTAPLGQTAPQSVPADTVTITPASTPTAAPGTSGTKTTPVPLGPALAVSAPTSTPVAPSITPLATGAETAASVGTPPAVLTGTTSASPVGPGSFPPVPSTPVATSAVPPVPTPIAPAAPTVGTPGVIATPVVPVTADTTPAALAPTAPPSAPTAVAPKFVADVADPTGVQISEFAATRLASEAVGLPDRKKEPTESPAAFGSAPFSGIEANRLAPAVEAGAAVRRSPAAQIADGITGQSRLTEKDGTFEMRMRLDPPDLGHVRVSLVSTGDDLRGRIVVADESVRRMVESQLPELRQRLEAAGVNVQRFDIATDPSSGGGNRNPYRDALPPEFAPQPQSASSTPTPARPAAKAAAGRLDIMV